MFSPAIIAQVTFLRLQQQISLTDACVETAQFFGIDELQLIAVCRALFQR